MQLYQNHKEKNQPAKTNQEKLQYGIFYYSFKISYPIYDTNTNKVNQQIGPLQIN